MSNIIVDNNGDIQKVTISDSSVEGTEKYNNTTIGTNWKKFLTEKVLKEIWHESAGGYLGQKCVCGRECEWPRETLDEHIKRTNRTFDNQNDMMVLYKALRKSGRWDDFLVFLWLVYLDESKYDLTSNAKTSRGAFVSWLFCLDGEDYENRCKMVAFMMS